MKWSFRRRALPPAAGEQAELPDRYAGISDRLRNALEQELCPDETLDRVVSPSPARMAQLYWACTVPFTAISAIWALRFASGSLLEPWQWAFWLAGAYLLTRGPW